MTVSLGNLVYFPVSDLHMTAARLAPLVSAEELKAQRHSLLLSLERDISTTRSAIKDMLAALPEGLQSELSDAFEAKLTKVEGVLGRLQQASDRHDELTETL